MMKEKCRRYTYGRLDIAMGKPIGVHKLQAFQNLIHNLLNLGFWKRVVYIIEIRLQIAQWIILHRQVEGASMFIPSVGFYKTS